MPKSGGDLGPRRKEGKDLILLKGKEDTRAQGLLAALGGKKALLVLTHTNPDPDGMASGFALGWLVEKTLGIPATLAYQGDIFRAENKAMVKVLELPLVPMEKVDAERFDGLALVDTQPGFGHTVLPEGSFPDVVVDHHVSPGGMDALDLPFVDIRPEVGATSSILTEYFHELDVEIPVRVASALYYGIRTDTADLSRNVSELDKKAHLDLYPLVDREALRAVTNPTVTTSYFQALRKALTTARIYGSVIICSLRRTDNPEMVAEVADLFLRLEGISWVVCGGFYNGVYYLSVRAAERKGKDAWLLLKDVLKGEGTFGGHGSVAGGRISTVDDSDRGLRRLENRLKRSFLEVLGERGSTPRKLG